MEGLSGDRTTPVPKWVWGIILTLSALPPATHCWIAHVPPAGTVATGLYGSDGAWFVTCMRMFETGFFAPYANCTSALGTHSPAYFPLPHFYLYGIVGSIGRILHISEMQMLGWANGLGGFLYLWAAYLFLRECFPRQANLAFVLLALGGGPGGLLYIITGLLNLHGMPDFDTYFYRYALYDLFEGPRFYPILVMPRLYYTLPLACSWGALLWFVRGARNSARRSFLIAAALLFMTTLLNLRYGPLTWSIVLLYLLADTNRTLVERAKPAIILLIPMFLAFAAVWIALQGRTAYFGAVVQLIRPVMWFSPFLSAILLFLPVLPGALVVAARSLPRHARVCAYAGMGYLTTFLILYVLYNAYYGNLWRCLDFTAALHIADVSLTGAVAGAVVAWVSSRKRTVPLDSDAWMYGWIALWFLAFVTFAVSPFAQGWFLRLAPERSIVFLGVPMAILAASGIQRLSQRWPGVARALTVSIMGCGVLSITVASLCFQGTLDHRPGRGPYAYKHSELITRADAEALDSLPGGVVLAPPTLGPSFGDILVQRRNTSTVYGMCSLDFSDRSHAATKEAVTLFFSEKATNPFRQQFVDDWCVDYIYCPDTPCVAENVVAALRNTPWLSEVVQRGKAVVFKVRRPAE